MLAERAQRLALSSNTVVPYFHPENSPLFAVRLYKIAKIFILFRHSRHTDEELLMFFRPYRRNKVQLPGVGQWICLLRLSRTGLWLLQWMVLNSNKLYKQIVRYDTVIRKANFHLRCTNVIIMNMFVSCSSKTLKSYTSICKVIFDNYFTLIHLYLKIFSHFYMAQNSLTVTQTMTQQLKKDPPTQHLKVQVGFPLMFL